MNDRMIVLTLETSYDRNIASSERKAEYRNVDLDAWPATRAWQRPGPIDVIQGKLLSLTKWIDLLSNKYETYGGTDTIKGIILAESRTLKYIICHASESLES